MKSISFLMLCLLSFNLFAGESTYHCEVKKGYAVDKNGLLKEESLFYKGDKFTVIRKTGKVSGSPFETSPPGTKKVDVLFKGDSLSSFFMLSYHASNKTANVLIIKESNDTKEKPFYGVGALGLVFSGICR